MSCYIGKASSLNMKRDWCLSPRFSQSILPLCAQRLSVMGEQPSCFAFCSVVISLCGLSFSAIMSARLSSCCVLRVISSIIVLELG